MDMFKFGGARCERLVWFEHVRQPTVSGSVGLCGNVHSRLRCVACRRSFAYHGDTVRLHRSTLRTLLILGLACGASVAGPPHNVILFVPDGLRAAIVDTTTAPAMARLRDDGVNFVNSHSLFPTFTTANASAFATGHLLGDTGDYSNGIYTGVALQGTVTPFLENDVVLRELNRHLGGNYLHEPSIIDAAAALTGTAAISTAVVGKLGPVAIFAPAAAAGNATLILDDMTGQPGKGMPISEAWRELIDAAKIAPVNAPPRGDNGTSGTFIANLAQQQYFLEMTLKVILPQFKAANQPFAMIYWSRDPDGTQHNQADGDINGPSAMTAIRVADGALGAIEQELKQLGLYETTNIIVAADHGFSTVAKDSASSALPLPPGFLALDLAKALQRREPKIRLFDPDDDDKPVDLTSGRLLRGNALIGKDPRFPLVVVAANGGSDLIYLPSLDGQGAVTEARRLRKLGAAVAAALDYRDYVSGVFVDRMRVGEVAGTLGMEQIGLVGAAITPRPAMIVNFRSTIADQCELSARLLCAREIADTTYPAGRGMHGSFSRADTWNFMAARGPDFRQRYVDTLPASNADIGVTIAYLLHLDLKPLGRLTGRGLFESLRDYESAALPEIEHQTATSPSSRAGHKTVLRLQIVDGHAYFDVAGYAGRSVGF